MESDLASLPQRLELMRQLAGALRRSNNAICQSDLVQFICNVTCQKHVCSALRHAVAQNTTRETMNDAAVIDEVLKIRDELRCLNQVQAALIRRGRRTVDIFCRVLANSGATYLPPA